jgi:hypothetical protein
VALSDESVISILSNTESIAPKSSSHPPVYTPPPLTKVRVAKLTVIPSRTESFVSVQFEAPGLRFLQARFRERSMGVHMANGIADVLPRQPFLVRVVNTSDQERRLHKGMILGHAMPHPLGIVALAEKEFPTGFRHSESDSEKVSPVPAKPFPHSNDDPPPLPDRPDVECPLWRDFVKLGHLTPQREEVLRMLEKRPTMCDGRFGHVLSTSHRIDLTPGARLVHSQPYRAGARAREAESAELQRMLKSGVTEPAVLEWASPVVLVSKPDVSIQF